MGVTIPPENAAWKRAPTHRQVCLWRCMSSAIAFPWSWLGGRSQRQLYWGQLGNMLIQHYPLTLSLFITHIKIVPNGHNRQGKPNRNTDFIQVPMKFKRKTNHFSDNRSWTGTYMNSIPQIIFSCQSLFWLATSKSWNLHPSKQLYSSKYYMH